MIKSPLNYSGSKNYIVDQIVEYVPENLDCFVDCMGGAFNVGCNINKAKSVIYNEINPFVFEIISMLIQQDSKKTIKEINQIIDYFHLEKEDKESYLRLREYYNKHKNPILLFTLHLYCFQNQLRFNQKHNFNTPIGNSGYNESIADRIRVFSNLKKNVKLINGSYKSLKINEFSKNTLFYFDPPYLITNATYNDGKRGFKGWDIHQEEELLSFLDRINDNGQKFMLSNVIEHNGNVNEKLLNWINLNNYRIIKLRPHNGRYGARKEVLVINF